MVAKKQDKKPVAAKQKKETKPTPSELFTRWIGSVTSLNVHTVIFAGAFISVLFGAPLDKVLLILTTVVSLEAIYLAIFIQMSVNRQEESLQEVEEDIDEIQEDVDEIQEDIDEIQDDIEDIQEVDAQGGSIDVIEADLKKLMKDVAALRALHVKASAPTQNGGTKV